jgi:hypothetical protein
MVNVLWFAGGVVLVVFVVDAAVRTLVLPRGSVVALTRVIWRIHRAVFDLIAGRCKTYEGRDRVMALCAPLSLCSFLSCGSRWFSAGS